MRKSIFAVSLLAAALVSPLAHAYKEGDIIVRAGAATVSPNDSSGNISVNGVDLPGGGDVTVGSDTQLGLTFAYMLQDHLGLELLAATPFTHEVKVKNSTFLGGPLNGKVGDVTHLPPTLSLQYYPMDPASALQPYAGIGVNYTAFFDEDLSSQYEALGFSNLELEDSWGVAGQLGVDYLITDNVLLNAAVWYIDIDTKATMDGPAALAPGLKTSVDVSIDPWVYMVGVGYKF